MAQARLEIKATADVDQAKRALKDLSIQGVNVADELRAKSQEGIKSVIGLFSPVVIASQMAVQVITAVSQKIFDFGARVFNAKQAYAELGKEVEKTAKDLNVGTEEAVRLESAARAAGVSAKKYAEALEDIKGGQTTLEEQASAWERIAGATKTAAAQRETLAGLIANAQQRREDRLGAAERAGDIPLAYYRGQALYNNSREGILQRAQTQAQAAETKRKAEEKAKADRRRTEKGHPPRCQTSATNHPVRARAAGRVGLPRPIFLPTRSAMARGKVGRKGRGCR